MNHCLSRPDAENPLLAEEYADAIRIGMHIERNIFNNIVLKNARDDGPTPVEEIHGFWINSSMTTFCFGIGPFQLWDDQTREFELTYENVVAEYIKAIERAVVVLNGIDESLEQEDADDD